MIFELMHAHNLLQELCGTGNFFTTTGSCLAGPGKLVLSRLKGMVSTSCVLTLPQQSQGGQRMLCSVSPDGSCEIDASQWCEKDRDAFRLKHTF